MNILRNVCFRVPQKNNVLQAVNGGFGASVSMSSERGFIGARSRRLLLQKSDALFQHPHLRLVPLHHRHHLRLQLLQLVLVLLLGFLVRRHQITAAHKHSTATETSSTRTDLTSITNTALAAKYQLQLDGNMNNILDMGGHPY